jgi:hypothetical protein
MIGGRHCAPRVPMPPLGDDGDIYILRVHASLEGMKRAVVTIRLPVLS